MEGGFQSVLNKVFINDIKAEVREARFGRLRCVKEMQELIRTHTGDRKYITMEEYVTSRCVCFTCSVMQRFTEITACLNVDRRQKGWEQRVGADDSWTEQDERIVEQRVEADDSSCSEQDEKHMAVRADWEDIEERDGKSEVVATEEEVRAGADDHCTEQDDDKVIVRADESEAQDGGINTDAVAGNSALESTGRTTSRGDEEKRGTGGVLVIENGVVSGKGGQETKRQLGTEI